MAASWNVDFIEPDIVLTKDDVPVIIHDIHLDSSTDVAKKFAHKRRKDGKFYVIDFTVKEIKELRVLERGKLDPNDTTVFPKRFPRNRARTAFQIPTLEEYLEMVEGLRQTTGYKLGIYPEIKAPHFHQTQGKNIVEIVYATLRKYGYEERPELIYIQSFDPAALKKLKFEIKTQIPLVQLVARNEWLEADVNYDLMILPAGLMEVAEYAEGIGPDLGRLYSLNDETSAIEKTSFVDDAHKAGLLVHPYTHRSDSLPRGFKTDDELLNFVKLEAKADGIFSDFADRVLNWVPGSGKKYKPETFRQSELL